MSSQRFTPSQRIGYYDGQRLEARDLRDDYWNETRLRGLHVRASHNTWGVALGFEVSRKGPQRLQVGPGIAYDARGREVLSAETLQIGPPPPPLDDAPAWWFDLVIGYDQTTGAEQFGSGCLAGPGPQSERPFWRWRLAAAAQPDEPVPFAVSPEVRLGDEVPLVRCRVDREPSFGPDLDLAVRRQAQAAVRPHVGGGQVNRLLLFDNELSAFTVSIDTTSAGFNQTPFYFARLTFPDILAGASNRQALRGLEGPYVSLRMPQRTSFSVDVRLDAPREHGPGIIRNVGETASVVAVVTWAGIESNGGCPPSPLATPLYYYLGPVFLEAAIQATGYTHWLRS